MRETWGAPSKGWPAFGPDGKVVQPAPKPETVQNKLDQMQEFVDTL